MSEEVRWFVTLLVLAFLVMFGTIVWAWLSDRREDEARQRDESGEED